MNWKGKELEKIRDLMDAMGEIDKAEDREQQAAEFMALYRAENEHADTNIGYLTGYYGPETMRRMQQLFAVAHPIFGTTTPTPDEALAAGKAMARDD